MYKNKLNKIETEKAINFIKTNFINNLEKELNLIKVCSPIFLDSKKGLNDHLTGVERPVIFNARNTSLEIIHSLAKWKREEIANLELKNGEGIWANMKAIRAEENEETPFHSLLVEQFDWELKISKEQRNIEFLKSVVKKIYLAILSTEKEINKLYPILTNKLTKDISFITSEELISKYPDKNDKERETLYGREVGSFFLIGIGNILSNGSPHDKRAPDYDDWDLNGDLFLYSEIHQKAIEISSMGIRVDADALKKQILQAKNKSSFEYDYHKKILNNDLPFTIGGGIGQSRLILFLLEKYHIGEFQRSFWTHNHREEMKKLGIELK
ncbi:MAG: aspartate--ammonia ligase [Metamycoplasmataceae bacterium]